MRGTWRQILLPGLTPAMAEAVLREALADRGGRPPDGPATTTMGTTWREWTTAPPAAPTLAWSHQTVRSGLPLTVVYTRGDGPWDPELARLLSARSGGYVLAGEENSRLSTWGLLLCHDGRVVRWRRQAQERGTESGLGPVWNGLWAGAVEELVGTPAPLLGPQLMTSLQILALPRSGGRVPVHRPSDDAEVRWHAVLVDVEPAQLDRLLEGHPAAPHVYHGLADPGLPAVSARFSVARGSGRAPAATLEADLRGLDPGLLLLRDDDVAEPERLVGQARRVQSAPGVFVVPRT